MKIFRAALKEIDLVSTLFNEYRIFYGKQADLEGAKTFIEERMRFNESVIFLAMDGESPMGFVQLYPIFTSVGMKRKWLLNDLFVAETYRRHGVGKALMNQAKEFALETKAAGILLETTKDNTKAQALYEQLGYVKEDAVFFYNLSL
ncbi:MULTISPECIES: GNAT family N-acetyltransferase [Metabacillus]|uniref:Acetyltransferase n=2 Tax=Metabacillus TaxID=2675233 RepID=A0A179T2U3_9BACI|nr:MULTISPECIES: GNAT family N-acetyltransferase [Metabacillus]OAS88024.1 acetyltransferase [Metabacillus litoralis]QNF27150.1 GNAT family N-acetyltransferase [Metabacillus sp. KUDC1714]